MKPTHLLLLIISPFLLTGCGRKPDYDRWIGVTMGTTYSIRLSAPIEIETLNILKAEVNASLKRVNAEMSPWQTDSEISQFNTRPADSPQTLSPAFALVVQNALSLNRATQGAFDPTLAPLIDLWGFGPQENKYQPTDAQVTAALGNVGCQHLNLDGEQLTKTRDGITLNLSAIAKGYGVDAAANVLRGHNIANFLVEIGGEVVAAGTAPGGRPWQIGVEYPALSAEQSGQLQGTVKLSDKACATSGDYHNYRTDTDGKIYSHILNPRTGRPIQSNVASVTVIADSCMLADGIATALFVMGVEDGLQWVNQMDRVDALFLVRTPENQIEEYLSTDFNTVTSYK